MRHVSDRFRALALVKMLLGIAGVVTALLIVSAAGGPLSTELDRSAAFSLPLVEHLAKAFPRTRASAGQLKVSAAPHSHSCCGCTYCVGTASCCGGHAHVAVIGPSPAPYTQTRQIAALAPDQRAYGVVPIPQLKPPRV